MNDRTPDVASERRLDAIRREAERTGTVTGSGVRPQGSPLPQATDAAGYYGLPLLKEPTWTWEVPLYFFVGGAAGACALLAGAAQLTGVDRSLVRDARRAALVGALLSAPLLISDLGRPGRFLNMLRVFKPRSAMSVGSWTLTLFGAATSAAVVADEIDGRTSRSFRGVGDLAGILSALTGMGMATYTGVLIGATSVPVWAEHAAVLPIHFGVSSLGAASSLLQLRGHDRRSLQNLALAAAVVETVATVRTANGRSVASEPLRKGHSGITTALAGLFSGPLPLLLRVAGFQSKRARRAASASALIGSLLTRLAWIEAGHVSSKDSRAPMALTGSG